MPGRKVQSNTYRYGFNGKERDNNLHSLTAYDYGFRIYNPALGKFLSVDPLTNDFPWFTPYQFAGNTPIYAVDLDGLETCPYHQKSTSIKNQKGEVVFEMLSEGDWNNEMRKAEIVEKGFVAPKRDASFGVQVAMGFTNMLLGFVGGASEAPAQMHYGDRIKPENKDKVFPVTGDGNLKRLTAETLLAPAIILQKIIQNPADGEAWGELAGFFFLGKMGKDKSKSVRSSSQAAKYMSGRFIIGKKTLEKVTKHLKQFGEAPENSIMLKRMEEIANGKRKATDIDINFAKHELRESEMMKNGMTYEEAHYAVLEEQGMGGLNVAVYEKLLYTPEAIEAGNKAMEKAAKKK